MKTTNGYIFVSEGACTYAAKRNIPSILRRGTVEIIFIHCTHLDNRGDGRFYH